MYISFFFLYLKLEADIENCRYLRELSISWLDNSVNDRWRFSCISLKHKKED